jgi:uncharacterized membrane protein
MNTLRRMYFYGVAFVSLEIVIWGVIGLARSFFNRGTIGEGVEALAGALSLILVGVPVFILHWLLAQRDGQQSFEARSSPVRAVFLYGLLLASLIPVVQNVLSFVNRSLLNLFAVSPGTGMFGGDVALSDPVVAILVNLVAAAYFYSVMRRDWQEIFPAGRLEAAAQERGAFWLQVRRLYRHIWLVYSLAFLVFGIQQILQYLLTAWQLVGTGQSALLVNGLSLLLVGTPLWIFNESLLRRAQTEPGEQSSLLRLVALNLLVAIGLIGTLAAASFVLYYLLDAILAWRWSTGELLLNLSKPLSIALPLAGVWIYYGRQLRQEASRSEGQVWVGRFFRYLFAILGLSAAFIGIYRLLSTLFLLLVSPPVLGGQVISEEMAAGMAALIAGLPVWLLSWRPLASEAIQEDESGDRARRFVVRRIYLFLAIFAGVLGGMFSAAALLYQVFQAVLGDPTPDLLQRALDYLLLILLFAGLAGYHAVQLRSDSRLSEQSLSRRHARYPVLILAPDEPAASEEAEEQQFTALIVAALQSQAPAIPVAVHSYSQGVPDESLAAVQAVILPSELVARPEEGIRLWLQAFNGPRLVVPTPAAAWWWVFGSGRSLPSLARQTARMVKELAEAEEPQPPRDASPWMTLIYIFAALFALLLVLLLLSLGLSLVLG